MKIEFNNLYTHFVFITHLRQPVIPEKNRIEIEKYITGIVKNNSSKLYAIYANPEHVHFLVSRAPTLSEVELAIPSTRIGVNFVLCILQNTDC